MLIEKEIKIYNFFHGLFNKELKPNTEDIHRIDNLILKYIIDTDEKNVKFCGIDNLDMPHSSFNRGERNNIIKNLNDIIGAYKLTDEDLEKIGKSAYKYDNFMTSVHVDCPFYINIKTGKLYYNDYENSADKTINIKFRNGQNTYYIMTPTDISLYILKDNYEILFSFNELYNIKKFNAETYKVDLNLSDEKAKLTLYDCDNQIKTTKANLDTCMKRCADIATNTIEDELERHIVLHDYFRDTTCTKLKTIIWKVFRNYNKKDYTYIEIVEKTQYKDLFHIIKQQYDDRYLNKEGTNPQSILGVSKKCLNFLNENKQYMCSYCYGSQRIDRFTLCRIKELEEKYGPNFVYLFELSKKLNDEFSKLEFEDHIKSRHVDFNRLDIIERLYDYNYTKNISKLLDYLFNNLPYRQGITDLREALNYLDMYIKLNIKLKKDRFTKYPDSLKKEIDLLNVERIIQENKINKKYIKKVHDIKKAIFEKDYENYYVTPLITEEDLNQESCRMNNCVRNYTSTLRRFDEICVSFRRKDSDKSFLTLELRSDKSKASVFDDFENASLKELIKDDFKVCQLKAESNNNPSIEEKQYAKIYVQDINKIIKEKIDTPIIAEVVSI